MSTTKKARVVVELAPEEAAPPPPRDDGWDGTPTGLRLSRPVLRDHVLCGPGKPCPATYLEDGVVKTCGSLTHQMEVRAARLPDGTWVGEEAQHVRELYHSGVVVGTDEDRARTRTQAEVDRDRGTFGTPENPAGHPELAERTLKDMEAGQLGIDLKGGPAAVVAREHDLAASELSELRKLREGQAARDDRLIDVLERLISTPAGGAEE
jgi:hypothetical protein